MMWPVLPAGYTHHSGYTSGYFQQQPVDNLENSERRKEKSRDAARCRRSRETEIFSDLAHALPLPESTINTLDKASVMRLAISFLRVRSVLGTFPSELTTGMSLCEDQKPPIKTLTTALSSSVESDIEYDTLFLKALEGFLLVVSADGDIIFLSENVNKYLGLSQIELMGQSIYEVSHPCDHNEVKEILTGKDSSLHRTFFLRMKCTLTSKGRNVNLKSATYKVIHCTGHMVSSKPVCNNDNSSDSGVETEHQQCLVAIGEPIPHPSDLDIYPGYNTFFTKHSLDMKFTYADDKMNELLGYDPDSLIGKSVFEFYHAQDSQAVGKSFKCLISKGQTQTERCRFLAHGGGYAWVLTQATLIYSNKGHKPESVVCVHFVTSEVEHKDEVYSCQQLEQQQQQQQSAVAVKQEVEVRKAPEQLQQLQPLPLTGEQLVRQVFPRKKVATVPPLGPRVQAPVPQSVTAKLFSPVPKTTEVVTAKLFTATPPQPQLQIPLHVPQAPIRAPQTLVQAPQIPKRDPEPPLRALQNRIQVPQTSIASPAPIVRQQPQSSVPPQQPSPQNQPPPTAVTAKLFKLNSEPQTATSKIFVPRTEEMNKGFLMFSDDESGLTMMKDESIKDTDLTHLAPTPGDTCVFLNDMPFFNDHFMLSDHYSPLLSEASKEISPASSPYPAFTYRDELSSGSLSPQLTHSPGTSSLPSLLGEDSPPMEEGTSISSLLGLDMVDSLDSDDLSVKAPYISMSEGDDLPLLMSHDLMWGAAAPSPNTQQSGWSSPPPVVGDKPDMDSSLAKLLRSDSSNSTRSFSQHSSTNNSHNTFSQQKKGPAEVERRKRAVSDQSGSARTNSKRSKHSSSSIPRPGVLDGGGKRTPPNGGSVLMNLLSTTTISLPILKSSVLTSPVFCSPVATSGLRPPDSRMRLKSLSLLDPDCDIQLMDITEEDCDVNAPSGALLHGSEILTALDVPM